MNKEEYLNNLKNLTQKNKNRSKVLGKGISALINTPAEVVVDKEETYKFKVLDIEISKIIAGKYQPRKTFNEEQLQELSSSIKQKGVLQPILLKKSDDNDNIFELIAGERRVRASKIAGLDKVPSIIVNFSVKEALEVGLIENLQRENLTPIEEAIAFKKLIEEFNYTHNDLADILGKSRSYITNYLRILSLPKEIQDLISAKQLHVGHAKIIVNYAYPMELAEEIVSKKLSVRDVEDLIRGKKIKSSSNKTLDITFSEELKNKINNLFKDCKVVVKTKNNGAGYIKINFNDKEKLQYLFSN